MVTGVQTCALPICTGKVLVYYLDKFTGLNHQEVAIKLIEDNQSWDVAANLDKFIGINHQEIAKKLIEVGKGETVAYYLNKFTGLNHQEVVTQLIEAGQGEDAVVYLHKFTNLNYQEIAEKLFVANEGALVMSNLAKLPQLNWSAIYEHLFEQNSGDVSSLDCLFTPEVLQDTNLEAVTPIRAELLAKLPPAVANSHFSYFSEKAILAAYLNGNYQSQHNSIPQNSNQFTPATAESQLASVNNNQPASTAESQLASTATPSPRANQSETANLSPVETAPPFENHPSPLENNPRG